MRKRYAIYWLEQKSNYGNDVTYYVLGDLFRIYDTQSAAEHKIAAMEIKEGDVLTILPIYTL